MPRVGIKFNNVCQLSNYRDGDKDGEDLIVNLKKESPAEALGKLRKSHPARLF